VGEERLAHVGGVGQQQVAKARQERMRVPDLRRSATVPVLEGFDGALRERRGIALQDHHLVTIAGERQGHAETRHAASDHDHAHRFVPSSTAVAPRLRRRAIQGILEDRAPPRENTC
jgi:hypothetical protein